VVDPPSSLPHDPASREDGEEFPRAMGQPAIRAVRAAGYTRLDHLATASEAELLELHGFGPKALSVVRDALHARGLTFAQEPGSTGSHRTKQSAG
jgi:hypothetical protein